MRVCARLTRDEGRGTRDGKEESSVTEASEASGRPSSIEISVADTGIGIKQEDLPKLFREFAQLEAPITKKFKGAGLGLALTRKLVELHGGKIRAESEFGKGSTFTFILPLKQAVTKRTVVSHNG